MGFGMGYGNGNGNGTMASSMDPVTQSSTWFSNCSKCGAEGQSEVQRRLRVKEIRMTITVRIIERQMACGIFKFPYFIQSTRIGVWDRSAGEVVEGFGDAIRNMEFEQNVESGGENLGDYHVSLSDDEENDVEFMSTETQSASNISSNAKETFIEDKAPKKMRTSGNNLGASLEGIDPKFLNICRSSHHNPFQDTSDESSDHNPFQARSDDTLKSSTEDTCSSDSTWEQKKACKGRQGSTCTTLVVPTKMPPPVTNYVLGLVAVTTWQQIMNKEFGIKRSKEDVGGSLNVRRKCKRKMM
nr:hypothetical protein [Tanacetum cinerariifolium]